METPVEDKIAAISLAIWVAEATRSVSGSGKLA